MYLGIDDTDSLRGGCTTHVLTELVRAARDRRIDLIGYPRLVRLNPNVPWKTRGNAALSARFGHGRGSRRKLGMIGGRPIFSFERGVGLGAHEAREWIDGAWETVRASSRLGEPGTDPALVALRRRPPASVYWSTVREIVPVKRARTWVRELGGEVRTEGSDRGVVGALASIAWPGRRRTFELLAYRSPDVHGRAREIDAATVRRAQRRWPSLFLCHDARTRRLMVAPHTPCPILFGLRSRSPRTALLARGAVRSERVDRWLLFATNQGTGDHLRPMPLDAVRPYTAARLSGHVAAPPVRLPGGHVRFRLRGRAGTVVECIAFEPTKTLPAVARVLEEGDRVRVWGSRRSDPMVRLEGIEVVRWSPRRGPVQGPACTRCGRRARSLGSARGYRCAGCGRRWPPEDGQRSLGPPPFRAGVFHPTPSARRHLAPLGPERPPRF